MKFKTKPYAHQLQDFEAYKDKDAFAFFWEMGCGKSWIATNIVGYKYLNGEIDTVVILCPNSLKRNWSEQIDLHLSDSIQRQVYVWPDCKKLKREEFGRGKGLSILILNYEATITKKFVEFNEAFIYNRRYALICDESTYVKNPKSKRSNAAYGLARRSVARFCLTGTPIANNPLDVYMQMQVVKPGCLGFPSYKAFELKYAVYRQIPHPSVRGTYINIVDGYRSLPDLNKRVAQFSSRRTKADCLDLPDKIFEKQYIEMSALQKRTYKQMKKDMVVELDSGEIMSADIALVNLLRLQQLTGGFVQPDDEELQELDNNPKMKALLEYVKENIDIGGKIIIWAKFVHEVDALHRNINDMFVKDKTTYRAVKYHGGLKNVERDESLRFFHNVPNVRVFIGTPKSCGMGLTLTEADKTCYYSHEYSLELRLQSEDRNHRIGTTSHVTYTDFLCEDSIDELIMQAIEAKKENANLVINPQTLLDGV